MNKDETAYLRLILDACIKARSYVSGMSRQDFLSDSKTQSAVIMQIQVIGELAKKVPDSMKSEIDIPWKPIMGMRDFIAHDYFSLDLEGAWQTVEVGIPEVEVKVREYLGASATDNTDGVVPVATSGDTVNTNTVGVYTIIYSATDQAGNIASSTRVVTVVEPESPEPTPTPSPEVSPEPSPTPDPIPEPEVTPPAEPTPPDPQAVPTNANN